jgi:hypothetical protein
VHGPRTGPTMFRGTFAAVTAIGALAALSVLAGASWSATGTSNANQYQYGTKVTICHHTHSKKHPQVTITVGQAAVKAHLKHGDTLGACSSTATTAKAKAKHTSASSTSTSTTSGSDSSTSHGSSHGQGHGQGHAHSK